MPTAFGLFPTNINPLDVLNALVAGTQQGVQNFMADLSAPSASLLPLLSLADLTNPLAAFSPAALPSPVDIVNTLSSMASTAYGTLLPTADIINALLTSIPAYNVGLFLDGIQELIAGDPMGLVNALGEPIAADVALLGLLGTFESIVIADAFQTIIGDFASLIPF